MSSSALLRSQSGTDLRRIENAPLLQDDAHTDGYLYGSVDGESIGQSPLNKKNVTPLPLIQLLLLAFMRISGPVAYSQIFPYINEMMDGLAVVDDSSQVGYYSGLVESIFALGQLFTCLRIGMLADQVGRKPVLLMGLFGTATFTILFGFSKTFGWAIATRGLAGALSANAVIINSAVADMTDETNQAQGYALIGLAFNIAYNLGPAIGGTFAKPERTFPNTFGKIDIFKTYPYLCPCVLSASAACVGLVCCALFFKETVARRRPSLKGASSYFSSADITQEISAARNLSAWQLALDPLLFSIFRSSFILNILNSSFCVVFSLFAFTPTEHGGLARNPEEIGYAISLSGVISGAFEVLFLPALQRRFGAAPLMRGLMALWPIAFMLFPFTYFIARRTMSVDLGLALAGSEKEHERPAMSAAVWIAIAVQLLVQRSATMCYPVDQILTRNAAPSNEILGTVFGLSQLIGSSARTIGPTFISSLFAFSKEHNVLGGNLVWVVMFVISLFGLWASTCIQLGRDNGLDVEDDNE